MYKKWIKGTIDVSIASVLLICLSPFLVVIILLLSFDFGKSVFFIQERPGKNAKVFKIYKFRTMNNKTNKEGKLLPDMQRLTTIGKIIRSTSLDELPQLFNVLKGDMSLVGPRPLLVSYLAKYTKEEMRRHEVKPGITGWAQVNGRNALEWHEKFKLDTWYVDHISFYLDIKIMLRTFLKILKRDSINANSNQTMKAFD
jgi:undecaprenyl phosphate N,N'-diacetylbacillosamine 1-phosphate transferase